MSTSFPFEKEVHFDFFLDIDQHEASLKSLVYKSDANPNIYTENYEQLQTFVHSSLESYRPELSKLLYPVFVHMYLELVCSDHSEQAIDFMNKFGKQQEPWYAADINRLSLVTKQADFPTYNEIFERFRNFQDLYTIRMSRDSYSFLKRFLQIRSQSNTAKASVLVNIIQEHLFIDVYEGLTRSKAIVEALSGGMFGDSVNDINRTKVYYGLLKEPDLKVDMSDVELDEM